MWARRRASQPIRTHKVCRLTPYVCISREGGSSSSTGRRAETLIGETANALMVNDQCSKFRKE